MAVTSDAPSTQDLVSRLGRAGVREADDSTRRRAEYSTDASNYRVPPQVVVFPRHIDEIQATLDVARQTGTPLTMRGAGTSIAGNSVGPGIVVDTSRYLNRVLEIDVARKAARVEPGCVMATLQKEAAPHGLRFGPDPSTWTRATLGGMIGNNACGPHAVAFGRTAENVISLDWVDGLGRSYTAGFGDWNYTDILGLHDFVAGNLATIRTEFGRFGRQVSGYSLEHLLPEHGSHLAKALVGTEGTCGLLLEAELHLVDIPTAPTLVVLGYPDMATAADAIPALLAHHPLAIEGLDRRLLEIVKAFYGTRPVPELPAGEGWLMVEVGGEDADAAMQAAQALAADSGTSARAVLPAGPEAVALWRIREDGAGLGGRTPSGAQGWPGWEDAAVPPEKLGTYLRELQVLLDDFGLDGIPYGHFGDGCLHIRIDFPLDSKPNVFRDFMDKASDLIAAHGGSLSGEHGDGRARSELLPKMYSPDAIDLLGRFKGLLDPENILNPGVIVDPVQLDMDLRRPQAHRVRAGDGLAFAHDQGNFTDAVHRCTGVGKCRAALPGTFMCPSYRATGDEKDSTRGRARVLQEMLNGTLIDGDWSSPEVADALDLCLSCKACASDCPTGIDMAAYKSEVLHRAWKGRIRPLKHYALGQLPRWTRMVGAAGPLVNAAMRVDPVRQAGLQLAGLDPRRGVPAFADRPFRSWRRHNQPPPSVGQRGDVLLFVDSFSDAFDPQAAIDAIAVLTDAGYRVRLPATDVCCGLTWITTGQLDGARARMRRLLDTMAGPVAGGMPVVGLEPSCTAALVTDLPELLPDDERAHQVAAAVSTLPEMLYAAVQDGWQPPRLGGTRVLAQPHCHQHATSGFGADRAVLEAAGAEVDVVDGCCGLAGNFGMEAGHYEVSVKVAENGFLPKLRAAGPGTVLLADGFSCRTQAADLADTRAVTLPGLLARALADT